MATQIDAGPVTNNGVELFAVPGANSGAGGFAQTTGVEVHVPAGQPSLEPSRAPFIDPGANAFNVNSQPLTPINTQFVMGVTGATVKFVNPA
jgi:hypothetical protein